MTKIAIIYYSNTGHTYQMARAISNIAWDDGEVLIGGYHTQ
jgi:flavodoxin